MAVWLRKDQVGIMLSDGLIRRADWLHVGSLDANYRAIAGRQETVLAEARQQAQAIIEAALVEAAAIHRQAQDAARCLHDEAYAGGRQAGIDDWTRQLLQASARNHKQLKQQRERMARMVLATVEKIAPLQDSQGVYRQVLRMLSKSMQAVRYVTVRVCPQELAHAEAALRELARGSAIAKLIEVSADEGLASGACLVESDQGIIDLSLGSQLKALRNAILEALGSDPVPTTAAAPAATDTTAAADMRQDGQPVAGDIARG